MRVSISDAIYRLKAANILFLLTPVIFFSACGDTAEQNGSVDIDTKAYDLKKIFVIGDSTVHNTTMKDGRRINYGWGDRLDEYLKNPNNLFNLAEPGASSRSYKKRSDLEYDGWFHNWYQTKEFILNSDLSKGGYLFIQFGHNDETDYDTEDDKHTLPGREGSFYNELKEYIDFAKETDLQPVLITPVERLHKDQNGRSVKTHTKYSDTIRELAKNEDTVLLDLQNISWQNFNRYESEKELLETFGYNDYEHFNYDGAYKVAGWIRELACNSNDKELCSQFK